MSPIDASGVFLEGQELSLSGGRSRAFKVFEPRLEEFERGVGAGDGDASAGLNFLGFPVFRDSNEGRNAFGEL